MICILHTDQKNAVTLAEGFYDVLLQGKKGVYAVLGKNRISLLWIFHICLIFWIIRSVQDHHTKKMTARFCVHFKSSLYKLFDYFSWAERFLESSQAIKISSASLFPKIPLEAHWKHLGSQQIYASLGIWKTRLVAVPQADIWLYNVMPVRVTCNIISLHFLLLFSFDKQSKSMTKLSNCSSWIFLLN